MTLSLDKTNDQARILQRRDASWQDYAEMRDRADLDGQKISLIKSTLEKLD